MLTLRFALEQFHVSIHHQAHELGESRFRLPSEKFFRFGGVTDENVHFRWTFVARVMFDELLPVEINMSEGGLAKFAYRMRLVSSENKIIAVVLLQHLPHPRDIFRRVTPVPFRF